MDIKLVHEDGRVWATTESGFTWHAFRINEDGQAVALCRKNVRPRCYTRTADSYWTLEQTHRSAMTVRCDRCQDKLADLEAPKESQGWTKKELRAAADEFAATAVTSTEVPAEGVAPAPVKLTATYEERTFTRTSKRPYTHVVIARKPSTGELVAARWSTGEANAAKPLLYGWESVRVATVPCGVEAQEPVATVAGEGPFQVVYLDTNTRRVHTRNHATELDAVRNLTNVELISNLELVSRSDNIDKTKFRF
ncbi:hypothetical protein AB0O20_11805 [Streptomyces kronopolitis]|uniref:hypothetical protein n=1 Tax=Streptomyces kronopolitis TaxID=1612435 RepID=UPI003439A28D